MSNRTMPAVLLGTSAVALSVLATGGFAQTEGRYAVDTTGSVVMTPFGLCVQTGSWTPGTTVPTCDLLPPPQVSAALAPEPQPEAPIAAAPIEPVAPPPVAAEKPEPVPAPLPQKLSLAIDTLFNFDKAELRPDAEAELDNLVGRLREANVAEVKAVGHTDSIGTDAYNQKLSERRADAVKSYLVAKGIPAEKIHVQGKGEREPVADNKTKEGRQENRRVDIEVAGTTARPDVVGATQPGSATSTQ
jgi:OOP family OmpA-OmpF porin